MAKRYSRAEWARIQSRLPEEDRIPWEQSPDMPAGPSAIARGESGTIGAVSAARNMPAASIPAIIAESPVPTLIATGTQPGPQPTLIQPTLPPPTKKVVSTYTDPTTGDVIAVYDDGTTSVISKGTLIADKANADLLAAEDKRRQGQSAFNLLREQFSRYGLEGLLSDVEQYIKDGLSPAEFTLRLRSESKAYQRRFAANEARIKKGLRALSEAEYIGLEDQYQDVMRRYGLPESYYTRGEMGRQEGFEKFIGGDVSPVELEDRVQTAQRRVINAAPQIKDALMQYYGGEINNGDILAYVLDPEKAIENIKRKVTAAEIGGAASRFGLGATRARAEELGTYGVTGEQAQAGFEVIGGGLERGRQLSAIYGGPSYTQEVAETELFKLPTSTDARKQRERLIKQERATFGGTTGVTGGALARDRAGAI